ncbi:kinase-like domain-containing protein [Irpex rosettiformis]|uniref:Kinase-like domain-containing protein n=1 Tax=Irpex rosettiformis TaxID=378272 RepID=A0ACB8TTJ3_9APHY|nr:kinase-like domain-containing protein [Irpex rosettiformis]
MTMTSSKTCRLPQELGRRNWRGRKRGKKRPKAIVINGVHGREGGAVEGGEEQEGNGAAKGESKLVLMKSTVEPPTPTTSLVVSEDILGIDSHGTVVFKGSLQDCAVAVKRLLWEFVSYGNLSLSLRARSAYYNRITTVIERPNQFHDIAVAFDPKKALRQITLGPRHLHGLKIIYRDIKPQNILVSHTKQGVGHRMLISDFGLCKKLELDQTSFYPTAHGAMAAGTRQRVWLRRWYPHWTINALGCLYYYIVTNGRPFGDRFERDANILKGAKRLHGLEGFEKEGSEAVDVISEMLSPEAHERWSQAFKIIHLGGPEGSDLAGPEALDVYCLNWQVTLSARIVVKCGSEVTVQCTPVLMNSEPTHSPTVRRGFIPCHTKMGTYYRGGAFRGNVRVRCRSDEWIGL